MASWEDGAEYAPVERPDGFATPSAAPLEHVAPAAAETPGAISAPDGYADTASGIPLDRLTPSSGAPRDPRQPFDLATTALTGDSAWGTAHRADVGVLTPTFDPLRPITTSSTTAVLPNTVTEFPPPSSAPVIPAGQQFPPPSGPPGQWAPQPPGQPEQPSATPMPVSTVQLLWTSAGLLLLGFFIPMMAIILGAAATLLTSRALPEKRGLSFGMGLSFSTALLAMWIVEDQSVGYGLARVASLIWMLVMFAVASSATNKKYRR